MENYRLNFIYTWVNWAAFLYQSVCYLPPPSFIPPRLLIPMSSRPVLVSFHYLCSCALDSPHHCFNSFWRWDLLHLYVSVYLSCRRISTCCRIGYVRKQRDALIICGWVFSIRGCDVRKIRYRRSNRPSSRTDDNNGTSTVGISSVTI
jgi:hypothetical protein